MATRLGSFRKINRQLGVAERRIERAWLSAVRDIQNAVALSPLTAAVEAGDISRISSFLITRESLTGVLEEIRNAYLDGAQTVAEAVPKKTKGPRGDRLLFRFDVTDVASQSWLARQSSEFITGKIVPSQMEAIRTVLSRGTRLGQNPTQTARDLVGRVSRQTGRRAGGIIGLSGPQSVAVDRAKAELRSGDPKALRNYLRRQRRDKRFDGTILRAIREGGTVSAKDTNKIIGRYYDRLLALRGETIARTEALQAFARGRHESMTQLIERAELMPEEVKRTWDSTGDTVTRPDHRWMDGQEQDPGKPFNAPDGSLMMHPGDTSMGAKAEQIVNCRCMEKIEADFIAAEARRN